MGGFPQRPRCPDPDASEPIEAAARLIGRPPRNPFQFEVGLHDGAWDILGFLCGFIGGGFWGATALACRSSCSAQPIGPLTESRLTDSVSMGSACRGLRCFRRERLQAVLRGEDGRAVAAAGALFPHAHGRLL
ncbi:DUF6790 family protein [Methylocapsa aurea]|uniref:DUF6790 family protein n=1 Tax=Methylocapsa aurea TaxID=663610 RepID=UPI003D18DF90